ncbi:hypothetical protein EVAR_74203_1 [Eumeta japonica]|uniref:Uncharacterized protein n=1 Tax=Eumeta variegata TaxID=151549 RepID=A0A4C1SD60_EUMVA|nr:hypothetical protein EVAR_74203_1 [Eumeta japonica]
MLTAQSVDRDETIRSMPTRAESRVKASSNYKKRELRKRNIDFIESYFRPKEIFSYSRVAHKQLPSQKLSRLRQVYLNRGARTAVRFSRWHRPAARLSQTPRKINKSNPAGRRLRPHADPRRSGTARPRFRAAPSEMERDVYGRANEGECNPAVRPMGEGKMADDI